MQPKNESRQELESKEERVAKITAKQAIIVALITALAGLSGAIIQKHVTSTNKVQEAKQSWLYITGVELSNTNTNHHVQIMVEVENTTFVYPSRIAGVLVSPNMEKPFFHLPIGREEYTVAFKIYSPWGPQPKRLETLDVMKIRQFNHEYECKLFSLDPERKMDSIAPSAVIKFELRY